jgi:hypothetical protein
MLAEPLSFPGTSPAGYGPLEDDEDFVPSRHLALEPCSERVTLAELGYGPDEIALCASPIAVSGVFRILSDEGAEVLRRICRSLEASAVSGKRIAKMVRGAAYRSRFVRGLCLDPDITAFLSGVFETELAPHTMPAQLGHINYAPEDLSRAVDRWHHDTLGFDYVLMVNDPATFKGGRFQYFMGTKQEAANLGAAGMEPPANRVVSPVFPGAGYALVQQGNMVVHRGGRLEEPAERMTFINGYVARDVSKPDPSRLSDLKVWDPPHVVYPEWARHKAWLARAKLDEAIAGMPFTDDRDVLVARLRAAIADVEDAIDDLTSDAPPAEIWYAG